ncbi:MAG: polyprenyl synthetase family protein [Nitrospirota bacterium]
MGDIWFHYKELLDQVEGQIKKGINSKVSLINDVAQYTLMSGGKRIRPLLLIISAKIGSRFDQRAIVLGSVVEFIHTATLLHDDVLDHAKIRRGQLAARNQYGNQASILVGDFLYTRAVCLIVGMKNAEMNDLLSETCNKMTEGETLQLAHTRDENLTQAQYLNIISYKTASLISASCALGAMASNASSEEQKALAAFGHHLGMAFQVADDTLDYVANQKRLGKSLGQDLKEGKMTLPLIHLFSHCLKKEKEMLVDLIKNGTPQKKLSLILNLMEQYDSIAYSQKHAVSLVKKAKACLKSLPPSTHKEALYAVADYVVSRDH